MRIFIGSLLIFCINFFPINAQSLKREKVNHINASTVFLKVNHQFILTDDETTISGTGFYISGNGHIVTNYHVVKEGFGYMGMAFPSEVKSIKVYHKSGTPQHKIYNARIMAVDKKHDLAILGVEENVKTPHLKIQSKPSAMYESQTVWIFGYPFGEKFSVIQRGPEISVSKGTIAALRHNDKNILDKIQVDGTVNRGNSGGPLVNDKGKVIGIISSKIGNSGLNFAVPSHYLKNLLEKHPVDQFQNKKASIIVNSDPSDARVFINWKERKKTPTGTLKVKEGWNSIAIIKKGYETWMKEKTFTGTEKIESDLKKDKITTLSIDSSKFDVTDNQKYISRIKENYSYSNNKTGDKKILLTEDFEEPKKFRKWDQSTGGKNKRTWYLQNNKLKQFKANGLLHAIYIGNKSWDNYYMQSRVKINGGPGDSRAGIIFRETSDGFYLFRIYEKSNKAELAYHRKNPFGWFILMNKKLNKDIKEDKWYEMGVYVNKQNIACFIDSSFIFNSISPLSKKGRVGFYSVDSKASFDNLRIYGVNDPEKKLVSKGAHKLKSYWFSDQFNLESSWWDHYSTEKNNYTPWQCSESGCLQINSDTVKQFSEMSKYKLYNFHMNLVLSVDKGNDKGLFEFFFRKQDHNKMVVRIRQSDSLIKLLSVKEGIEKTLKTKKLKSDFFNKSMVLKFTAHKDSLSFGNNSRTLISYKGEDVLNKPGKIGFATKGITTVFHRMNIASIRKKVLAGIKPDD